MVHLCGALLSCSCLSLSLLRPLALAQRFSTLMELTAVVCFSSCTASSARRSKRDVYIIPNTYAVGIRPARLPGFATTCRFPPRLCKTSGRMLVVERERANCPENPYNQHLLLDRPLSTVSKVAT